MVLDENQHYYRRRGDHHSHHGAPFEQQPFPDHVNPSELVYTERRYLRLACGRSLE